MYVYLLYYIQFINYKCIGCLVLSSIIYCGFPIHIGYNVLIKLNLQMTHFVYERERKKKVSNY